MRKASDIENKLWNKEFHDDENFLVSHAYGDADHAAHPGEVMEQFDKILKTFGLQVVEFNTDGDFYAWKVEKLDAKDQDSTLVRQSRGPTEAA